MHCDRCGSRRWKLFVLLVVSVSTATIGGCSRQFYRRQADDEVYALVHQKSDDPRWAFPGFSVELDPRSRYFHPYQDEHPPMPPDDPASHQLMHYIDGKKGYSHWHRDGELPQLENPSWRDYLDEYTVRNEDGSIRLGLEDAVRLALIHSPDYQEEIETLYLSALDVTTERFRFDVQFFGGNLTQFDHIGEERPGGESSTLTAVTDGQFERQFASAGELLVGIANTTVWEFFGDNDMLFTTSLLNFSLVQPLLRAGGRAVALEQLTIAERGLLANLRTFQRFRQGFFTDVAIGDGVGGLSRRGGFFGGTGLTGFTGQGAAGFGGVGAATGFGRGGFGGVGGGGGGGGGAGLAGGGAGQVGGFIGLVQQVQEIRNREENLELQLRTLQLLEANLEAGLIDLAQVDQFRQNIETERANLLQARNSLENSLDNFKRGTLGLPPDLRVTPDDSLIEQFRLLDPGIRGVLDDMADFIDEFGEQPQEPSLQSLQEAVDDVESLVERSRAYFRTAPDELLKTRESAPRREAQMTAEEIEAFRADLDRLGQQLVDLQARFDSTAEAIGRLRENLTPETRQQTANAIVAQTTELQNIVNELSLIQARARLERITVEPIDLTADVALEIARANRLDWMNNRAALVDTWRLIEFNANALKSDVTVRFSGDLQTVGGDNPIRFRDEGGTLRASLELDPPFTRLVERNNFRQQLIQYQQDRRQLIQFEDGVLQSMRAILRNLTQLRLNLEIQRRAVEIAIRRVDQTREVLSRPVPPTQPGQPPAAFGPTAAQNLLSALADLRDTQNNLMSVWLNYLAGRMTLYRELGVMRIDENGMWIDEPLDEAIRAKAHEVPLPPAVPPEWFHYGDDLSAPGDSPAPLPPLPESKKGRPVRSALLKPLGWMKTLLGRDEPGGAQPEPPAPSGGEDSEPPADGAEPLPLLPPPGAQPVPPSVPNERTARPLRGRSRGEAANAL